MFSIASDHRYVMSTLVRYLHPDCVISSASRAAKDGHAATVVLVSRLGDLLLKLGADIAGSEGCRVADRI